MAESQKPSVFGGGSEEFDKSMPNKAYSEMDHSKGEEEAVNGLQVFTDEDSEASITDEEDFGSEKEEEDERTFELFPKLPVEVRLKIWNNAMPSEARYVMIITTGDHERRDGEEYDRNKPVHFSNDTKWFAASADYVPELFFACKEARTEVMKLYTPIRGTAGEGAIWIDVKKDVLCLVGRRCHTDIGSLLNEMPAVIRSGLTRLALDDWFLKRWKTMKRDLLSLPALADLYFGEYIHYFKPHIIGDFQIVENTERAGETNFKALVKRAAGIFGEIKGSHGDWKQPSISIGSFEPDFFHEDEVPHIGDPDRVRNVFANPFADDPENDPFSEHYIPRDRDADDLESFHLANKQHSYPDHYND